MESVETQGSSLSSCYPLRYGLMQHMRRRQAIERLGGDKFIDWSNSANRKMAGLQILFFVENLILMKNLYWFRNGLVVQNVSFTFDIDFLFEKIHFTGEVERIIGSIEFFQKWFSSKRCN